MFDILNKGQEVKTLLDDNWLLSQENTCEANSRLLKINTYRDAR